MKFLIVFALAFATVSARDLYSRSIEVPVLESEGRITNGKNAAPGQFKYQVGLLLITGSNEQWCGGSLISENWILTAGHCTHGVSLVKVYLGSTKRLAAEKVYNASKSDIFTHPGWNSVHSKNDIALIRIPTTHESRKIGIVKIPSNGDGKYLFDIVIVAGWGLIDDNTNTPSNNLKYGVLQVHPGSVCSKFYGDEYSDGTSICVATPNKVSTCNGDSGGALVLIGQNLQIGLVSYGALAGCAKGFPIVFTKVGVYRFWIKSLTGIY